MQNINSIALQSRVIAAYKIFIALVLFHLNVLFSSVLLCIFVVVFFIVISSMFLILLLLRV